MTQRGVRELSLSLDDHSSSAVVIQTCNTRMGAIVSRLVEINIIFHAIGVA